LSARAMVTVLRHVAETPWATTFFKSLPEPGEGTLSERLHGLPVRAKTGSLTDARALSGRLLRNGEPIYFSLLVDGITRNATAVRERQDDVVRALAGCDSSPVHTS
jgi:D-alanyl-D-alanine carboxypeptidase/D-alanyl-D-alanine-endopeptidase (penicillin-binding protein 4)